MLASKYLRQLGWLGIFLILLSFQTSIAAETQVTLQWDPSSTEGVVGYIVNYGTAPRAYSEHEDVGDATSFEIPGLREGIPFYIAVTA